jgi:hypothetical protein
MIMDIESEKNGKMSFFSNNICEKVSIKLAEYKNLLKPIIDE